MTITSVKSIVATGLAALALMACGAGESPGGDVSPDGAGGAGGGGGGGGHPNHPGEGYQWPLAWVFKCYDIQEDVLIKGQILQGPVYQESYVPSEVTIKVGQILAFEPFDSAQNISSGVYPTRDYQFETVQGWRRCLIFDQPGTYPFFSFAALGAPMTGLVHVE